MTILILCIKNYNLFYLFWFISVRFLSKFKENPFDINYQNMEQVRKLLDQMMNDEVKKTIMNDLLIIQTANHLLEKYDSDIKETGTSESIRSYLRVMGKFVIEYNLIWGKNHNLLQILNFVADIGGIIDLVDLSFEYKNLSEREMLINCLAKAKELQLSDFDL